MRVILRSFLFAFFFAAGMGTLSFSILCNDLSGYYRNKLLVKSGEQALVQLQELIAEYDILISQVENDPNFTDRAFSATFGKNGEDADIVYPELTREQLEAAKQVLLADDDLVEAPGMPGWLVRSIEPGKRTALFLAGAFLVLLSFLFFGARQEIMKKQRVTES